MQCYIRAEKYTTKARKSGLEIIALTAGKISTLSSDLKNSKNVRMVSFFPFCFFCFLYPFILFKK